MVKLDTIFSKKNVAWFEINTINITLKNIINIEINNFKNDGNTESILYNYIRYRYILLSNLQNLCNNSRNHIDCL
jgi:hypothetical protein